MIQYYGNNLIGLVERLPTVVNITNPYPTDESLNIPLQPTIYVTINHTTGDTMNISWYYGATIGNENTILGNENNITNSTQSKLFFQASNRSTTYYWRVMANDGIHYINKTYSFTSDFVGGGISRPSNIALAVMGMMFGIFGLLSMFALKKRKKNKEGGEKENDDHDNRFSY